ncbi:hypothetical protein ACNOYE_01900 [Nannocystaceae bacterium ST9]
MLAQRPPRWLLAALLLAGCRVARVDEPEPQPRTRRVEVPHDAIAVPSWERAAVVRLWTVGLEREQVEALRPQPERPIFVRLSPDGLEVVACAEAPSIEWRFEPESPVEQRFVWSGEQLEANVRVGARLRGREEVEVGLIPIGSYRLAPDRKPTLRRQACEGATHVVVGVRVGQTDAVVDDSRCSVDPDATTAPPGCDVPWMVELLAIDPLARPGPLCPGSTSWTGRYCRSAQAPNQERAAFCDASTYDLPQCDPRWSGVDDWSREPELALPERLEPDDIEPVMATIASGLADCVPGIDEWSMTVVVEGSSGRVVEFRVPAWFSEPTATCMTQLLRPLAFPSFAKQRQPFHWPPLGRRDVLPKAGL